MSLSRFDAVARLSIGGETSQPFTLRTLAPDTTRDSGLAGEARALSARRFARPVEAIDQELGSKGGLPRDLAVDDSPAGASPADVVSELRSGNHKNGVSPHEPSEIAQDSLPKEADRSQLLESRELHTLRCLASFHRLNSAHVEDFLFEGGGKPASRAVTTRRVLAGLMRKGLVTRSTRMLGGPAGGSARFVYQLTDAGYRLLARIDTSFDGRRPSPHDAARVEHALMTADVVVAFRRAARADPAHAVALWEPDWVAARRIGGSAVVPDGLVRYATESCEIWAFVEIDLATESPSRFRQKVTAYLAAHAAGEWRKSFVREPLVLTVVPSRARATTLCRSTADVLRLEGVPESADVWAFAFVALEDLRGGGGVLGEICQIAGRPGLHELPRAVTGLANRVSSIIPDRLLLAGKDQRDSQQNLYSSIRGSASEAS